MGWFNHHQLDSHLASSLFLHLVCKTLTCREFKLPFVHCFARGQVSKDGKRTRCAELNIFDFFCQEGEGVHILGCLPAQDAVHHQDDVIFFVVGDPDLNLYLPLAFLEGNHNPMHIFHTVCSCVCYLAGMQSQKVDRKCFCTFDSFDHQTFQVPKMRESSPIKAVCRACLRESAPPK